MSKASSDLSRELNIMKRFAKTLDECTPEVRLRVLNWCNTRREQELEYKINGEQEMVQPELFE